MPNNITERDIGHRPVFNNQPADYPYSESGYFVNDLYELAVKDGVVVETGPDDLVEVAMSDPPGYVVVVSRFAATQYIKPELLKPNRGPATTPRRRFHSR